MRRFEFWKLGLQNVLASSMRSMLTVLGMAIGVAAVLAVISLGAAGRAQVKQEISRLGIDRVQVTATDAASPLRARDGEFLQKTLNTQVDGTFFLPCIVFTETKSTAAALVGCSFDYWERMAPELVKGNVPLPGHWYIGSPMAMVGEEIAKTMNLSVGDWFSADGIMLCCCGVMGKTQQASQMDMRKTVVVSCAFLRDWMGDAVQEISISVPDGALPEAIAATTEEMLLSERNLRAKAVSLQVQAEAADSVLMVFVDVLRWVALICMAVGGIGVTNILLVSVRERRREIGVMQSLGATRMQICGLFLYEALIYALAGGILGLLLGGALIAVAGKSIGIVPIVKAGDCTVVFLAALLLGLLSGVAPAAGASMMKPVDALRDD